jgi:hypothetical protein
MRPGTNRTHTTQTHTHPYKTHTAQTDTTHHHPSLLIGYKTFLSLSRVKRERMFLAPVENHNLISSLNPSSKVVRQGRAPSKTHLFRCFQILQAPRITILLNPFLLLLGIMVEAFLPHSVKTKSLLLGPTEERPIGVKILCQNCLVKTQLDRICCTVSSSWSHKTQFSG